MRLQRFARAFDHHLPRDQTSNSFAHQFLTQTIHDAVFQLQRLDEALTRSEGNRLVRVHRSADLLLPENLPLTILDEVQSTGATNQHHSIDVMAGQSTFRDALFDYFD